MTKKPQGNIHTKNLKPLTYALVACFFDMKQVVVVLFVLICLGCKTDETIVTPIEIGFVQPTHFPKPTYDLEDNPISTEGFILGRKLFYDNKLSFNNTISCAECHNQSFAFTHHGHDLSEGVLLGKLGTRNTQPLQNLAFMKDFTWDGGVNVLWKQPVIPITEEVEMNESLGNVVQKLKADDTYQKMFAKVYGTENAVTSVNMLKALAKFMGAMVSSNSTYDKYVKGEVAYSQTQKKGLTLFEQKCATCHSGALFTNQDFINNGIGVNANFPDELGRSRITISNPDVTLEQGKAHPDYYKFKVPSLRNVAKTFPYMHDGRFTTLQEVLNFYDTDTYPYMKKMDNLDHRLIGENKGVETLGISMAEDEKTAIIAFLQTLTDDEFLNDERFAKP